MLDNFHVIPVSLSPVTFYALRHLGSRSSSWKLYKCRMDSAWAPLSFRVLD